MLRGEPGSVRSALRAFSNLPQTIAGQAGLRICTRTPASNLDSMCNLGSTNAYLIAGPDGQLLACGAGLLLCLFTCMTVQHNVARPVCQAQSLPQAADQGPYAHLDRASTTQKLHSILVGRPRLTLPRCDHLHTCLGQTRSATMIASASRTSVARYSSVASIIDPCVCEADSTPVYQYFTPYKQKGSAIQGP